MYAGTLFVKKCNISRGNICFSYGIIELFLIKISYTKKLFKLQYFSSNEFFNNTGDFYEISFINSIDHIIYKYDIFLMI